MDVRVTLTVVSGQDKGLSITMDQDRIEIGRRECDINLADRKVSARHAAILVKGRHVWIQDLNSRNGLLVNDAEVEEVELKNLDRITLGFTQIKVLIVEDLETFRRSNLASDEIEDEETAARQDIGSLIQDEMKKFSKWDLSPAYQASEEGQIECLATLFVLEGPDAGKKLPVLKRESTLGRGRSADIMFRDLDVSRNHARIVQTGEQSFLIEDLGSTNGTFVNQKREKEAKLLHEDVIRVGSTTFRFLVKL